MKKLIPNKNWLSMDDTLVIRMKCAPVDPNVITKDDELLMQKMQAYIDESYVNHAKKLHIVPGIAIAANQLGVPKQIIYVHFDGDGVEHKYMLFNPKIISSSVLKTYLPHGEGCLSVANDYPGVSIRYKNVKVSAYDYFNKKNIVIDATGILAICLQHEIDHLNGLVYYDRIGEIPSNATPYEVLQLKEEVSSTTNQTNNQNKSNITNTNK